eukprot:TRINITY_DN4712_c0_g3_i1.p1 TRINITY_DN4712_c0_g3~~TRINITY_DN4712_c0_g3_i1.p1  ORF type:complete len:182 (-),score=50.16 TRINITY_DN4712_c0_g3_i1:137-682(-)
MGSSVMLWHCIKIVSASLFGALLSEAISYVLIYRTESYQRLKENISKTQKKLDTMKEGSGSMAERKRQKKIDRFEEDLKFTTQELSLVKMKSMLAVAFTMITLFSMLNSHFDGVVVAKLPFTPIEFFQRISHRNLPGSDFTDCSMSFLYVMCSMFIRSNVQKFFGNAPPKTPSIFEMAKQE